MKGLAIRTLSCSDYWARLKLYSYLDRFGQRENLPQVEQCTNPDQLYKRMEDDTVEVSNIRFCTEEVLEVVYTNKEEVVIPNNRTNVFIIQPLYKTSQKVENQFSMGAKVLSFKSGSLTFPSTFGINELKKGYFPHGFNIPSD